MWVQTSYVDDLTALIKIKKKTWFGITCLDPNLLKNFHILSLIHFSLAKKTSKKNTFPTSSFHNLNACFYPSVTYTLCYVKRNNTQYRDYCLLRAVSCKTVQEADGGIKCRKGQVKAVIWCFWFFKTMFAFSAGMTLCRTWTQLVLMFRNGCDDNNKWANIQVSKGHVTTEMNRKPSASRSRSWCHLLRFHSCSF